MKIDVRNPWSGQLDYSFTNPSAAELERSVSELHKGQSKWQAQTLQQRLEHIKVLQHKILAEKQAIIECLQEDTGRIRVADLEFNLLMNTFDRLIAMAPDALQGKQNIGTMHEEIVGETLCEPYGIALNIAPWNFPLVLSFLDALPALIAGNAVVIKPSEVTPRWAAVVSKVIESTPCIKDVLLIIVGDGATASTLIEHSDVVSFTGSVRTGRIVLEKAACCFIPAYMELGGKDAALVFADADLEESAKTILMSAIVGTGQACQSLERAYVHHSIHDAFIGNLLKAAQAITINYPGKDDGFLGPFIFDKQAEIVRSHIEDAVSKGAEIVHGGEILDHGGKWLKPTILKNVTHDMLIMTEETFGPVIPVMVFNTEDEAIALANDSIYGLSGSVFSQDSNLATRVASQLKAGAITINDASLTSRIHNVEHESYGLSGIGRSRFGLNGIRRYTREKAILRNTTGKSMLAAAVR